MDKKMVVVHQDEYAELEYITKMITENPNEVSFKQRFHDIVDNAQPFTEGSTIEGGDDQFEYGNMVIIKGAN